ncbi:hypothetical protein VPH35_055070 [Triticum aestivum]
MRPRALLLPPRVVPRPAASIPRGVDASRDWDLQFLSDPGPSHPTTTTKHDGGCSGRPPQIPTSDAPSARAPLGDPLQFNSLAAQYREDPLVHSVACRGHVDDGEKHNEVDVVQYLTVDFPPALHPQESCVQYLFLGI